jgi:putative hemolysin
MSVSPLLTSRITPSRLAASGPIEGRQATGNVMSAAASQTSVLSSVARGFAGKIGSWLDLRRGPYHLRLASCEADRVAAFRLRFLVFNVELTEGLKAAYATGQDRDEYDAFCDHLIVEHSTTAQMIGTYRLQRAAMAAANAGFYSEREFDFSPYKQLGNSVIELGRACVHRDHRSSEVLYLLWRGIAQYAIHHGGRYLVGCSSLTSQDPAHGIAVYEAVREHLVDPQLRTAPQPAFAMPLMSAENASDKIPKLLRAYLAVGAKICSPPAIDREFKTIDFLTLLDLEALHPRVYARFMKI